MIGTETGKLASGQPVKMGCKLPPELRFAAVPTWAEANPVLDESEWEEHDEYAPWQVPIKHQHYSNCTNASLAGLAEMLWAASGNGLTNLSMSFLYAQCNGGVDEGAFCRDLAAKFVTAGLCTDVLAPETMATARSFSAEATADAATRCGFEIYQCMSWGDVGSALTRRFGVYHGFCLGGRFFNTGSDGVVPSFDGSPSNGHAQYSRGLVKINGAWRTITPNSWDTTFGKSGIGLIDKSYFGANIGRMVNLDCYAIRAMKQPTTNVPAPKA